MILWLVFLVPLAWFIMFKYKRRNMYKLAAQIPTAKESLPVIGVAHTVCGDTEDIMLKLQKYSQQANENDGILKCWLVHILYFFFTNPVDIEMVLKTCLEKDDLHRFLRTVTGNGGIFAPVSIWRRRRKIIVPALSPKFVEHFSKVYAERSEKLADQLSDCTGKGNVSVWSHATTYNLDSICETAMGVKINSQENSDTPFLEALYNILNMISERIFHLWLQPDWLYKLFPQYKEHEKCRSELHGFIDKNIIKNHIIDLADTYRGGNPLPDTPKVHEIVIKDKREKLKLEQENKTEADQEINLSSYSNKTFLDLLISLSGGAKGYTDLELREEIVTLVIAATDTSAHALGYTLKLLGKYPNVQDKVYQELYDVFGDSDRAFVKEDLQKLKYMERVIKESLRLFPPVPFIIRKVLEDITLPSGKSLPAGSGIVISIWGVHRDPKYWGPTVEHFDPDRFLPERFNAVHACSFMPFSSGPRNCPGYLYGLMSVKEALSAILRRYKVVGDPEVGPIPHIRVKLDIMMKDVDDYQLALERRATKTST